MSFCYNADVTNLKLKTFLLKGLHLNAVFFKILGDYLNLLL